MKECKNKILLIIKTWNLPVRNLVESSQIKVRFFIYCANFSNHYNFLNIKKNLNKFGICGQPRSSEILKWKIFSNFYVK